MLHISDANLTKWRIGIDLASADIWILADSAFNLTNILDLLETKNDFDATSPSQVAASEPYAFRPCAVDGTFTGQPFTRRLLYLSMGNGEMDGLK